MQALKSNEKLIAKQSNYISSSTGSSYVKKAYDIYLAREGSGDYVLVVFMILQYLYEDNPPFRWTKHEKKLFSHRFEHAVNKKWGNHRVLKRLSDNKKVYLDFRFQTLIGNCHTNEHWEVRVTKIEKGGFKGSAVNRHYRYAKLDSEDLVPATKKRKYKQRGAVHEFGHMIGLPDEYKASSPHVKDFDSIMNSGEKLYSRHDSVHMQWLESVLKQEKIS